jgi:hypothetical protein
MAAKAEGLFAKREKLCAREWRRMAALTRPRKVQLIYQSLAV